MAMGAAAYPLCHDEWGATDVDTAMEAATAGGHIDIVELCLGWGASAVDQAMSEAT